MPAKVNLLGQRFSRLTVVRQGEGRQGGRVVWVCRCDCGAFTTVTSCNLRAGNTTSCGCYRLERLKAVITTHGQNTNGCISQEYRAWQHAKARCYDHNDQNWQTYGGRGIKMCDEWRDDYAAFFAHIGPKPSPTFVLDRIDNDGNYEPGNVRWVTPKVSANNRRPRPNQILAALRKAAAQHTHR